MRSNQQKIKLLKLYEILHQETDSDHVLRTSELCNRLIAMDISCDRRTLARDIKLLNDCGYEVLSKSVSHEKGFYVEDRSFDPVELRILIDAVQAANFITQRKTESMINKIAALGGSKRARILKRTHISFGTCKHTNEQILYSVDALREAIEKSCKASFLYFDLNDKGEQVFRKNRSRYLVEPLTLIYNEDNYYLICYNTNPQIEDKIVTYRVDRMFNAACEDQPICELARTHRKEITARTSQMFKMFNGTRSEVVLEFSGSIIGSIYDKFGEGIRIRKLTDDRYRVTLDLAVSPTFFGWVFQFGSKMKIIGPVNVVEQYIQHIENVLSQYPDR